MNMFSPWEPRSRTRECGSGVLSSKTRWRLVLGDIPNRDGHLPDSTPERAVEKQGLSGAYDGPGAASPAALVLRRPRMARAPAIVQTLAQDVTASPSSREGHKAGGRGNAHAIARDGFMRRSVGHE